MEGGAHVHMFTQRDHYGNSCKGMRGGRESHIGYIRACFGLKENGISLPGQHTKYRLKSAAHYLNVHLIRLVLLSFISPVSQQRWSD